MSNIFRDCPSGRILSNDLIKDNPIANELWEEEGTSALFVQDSSHSHGCSSPVLLSIVSLAVAASLNFSSINSPALTEIYSLENQQTAHTLVVDSPILEQIGPVNLEVDNASHSQSADHIIYDTGVAPSWGDPRIIRPVTKRSPLLPRSYFTTPVHILVLVGATNSQGTSEPALAQTHILALDGSTNTQDTDSSILAEKHIISPDSSVHIQKITGEAVIFKPGENSDDCTVAPEGVTTIDLTSTRLYFGANGWMESINHSGYRVINVIIPQGSTILSAKVRFQAFSSQDTINCDVQIKGENADDTVTFSTYANYIGRTRTTESVDWNNVESWVIDTDYDSPDISNIIQEIVDRPLWDGSTIVLFVSDNGSTLNHYRSAKSYDLTTDYCARLIIQWEGSPTSITETTGTQSLVSDSSVIGQGTDEPSLTHTYVLALNGANNAQGTDSPTLAVKYDLSVNGSTNAQGTNESTIAEKYIISDDSSAIALSFGESSLTHIYSLDLDDCSNAISSDSSTIGQFSDLSVNGSIISQGTDEPTFTHTYSLSVANSALSFFPDTFIIITEIYFNPDDSINSQSCDLPTISSATTIDPDDVSNNQVTSEPALTHTYVLAVDETVNSLSSDVLTIYDLATLAFNGGTINQSTGSPLIVQTAILRIDSYTSSLNSNNSSLTKTSDIDVDDSAIAQSTSASSTAEIPQYTFVDIM